MHATYPSIIPYMLKHDNSYAKWRNQISSEHREQTTTGEKNDNFPNEWPAIMQSGWLSCISHIVVVVAAGSRCLFICVLFGFKCLQTHINRMNNINPKSKQKENKLWLKALASRPWPLPSPPLSSKHSNGHIITPFATHTHTRIRAGLVYNFTCILVHVYHFCFVLYERVFHPILLLARRWAHSNCN